MAKSKSVTKPVEPQPVIEPAATAHEEKRKEQPDLKSETVADGQHRMPVHDPERNTVDRVIRR